jgi:hypothetical protein
MRAEIQTDRKCRSRKGDIEEGWVAARLSGNEGDLMSWVLAVRGTRVFVSVSDPLAPDDWQALYDEIVREAKSCEATAVVLPATLPTTMGMADELSRSLASNLRERGFAVSSPGSGVGSPLSPARPSDRLRLRPRNFSG